MNHCVKCGAPLAPDAQFCSKCGTPVVAAAPVPPPVAPRVAPPVAPIAPAAVPVAQAKRSTWWIVPVVIVGLVVVAWLLLAGLPFGREKKEVVTTASTETIAEGTAQAPPTAAGTVVEIGTAEEPPFVTETTPPPMATNTVAAPPVGSGPITTPPVTTTRGSAPITTTTPTPTRPAPTPTRTAPTTDTAPIRRPTPQNPVPEPRTPRVEPTEPGGEISEAEATGVLRNHLAGSNPYDVSMSCLQLRSAGYVNVGYTYSVWDSCVEGGGSRMLGRWRVDAKTREVFRQRDDGRYLRP